MRSSHMFMVLDKFTCWHAGFGLTQLTSSLVLELVGCWAGSCMLLASSFIAVYLTRFAVLDVPNIHIFPEGRMFLHPSEPWNHHLIIAYFFYAGANLTSWLRGCRLWIHWSWLWKHWRRFRNGSTPRFQHTLWRKNMALQHHLQWNQPSGHVRYM